MRPSSIPGWIHRMGQARDEALTTWRLPHDAALVGLHMATRCAPTGDARPFRDDTSLWAAWWRDELTTHDPVRVGGVTATAGRSLAASLLPRSLRGEASGCVWTRVRVAQWLRDATEAAHVEVAARSADALEGFGDALYARLGASWCSDDLRAPRSKAARVAEVRAHIAKREEEYRNGLVTDGERYNRAIDVWTDGLEGLVGDALREHAGSSLESFAVSHTEGGAWRAVASHVGLVAGHWGTVDERPILPSFMEGLDAHDMMALARHRRSQTLGEQERLATLAALFGDLCGALADLRVTTNDCGATEGIVVSAEEGTAALVERLKGRVLLRDVLTSAGEVVARAGTTVRALDAARWRDVERAVVRSPWSCRVREGVCARCQGRSPDDDIDAGEGDAVGLRAASSLTMSLRRVPIVRLHVVTGGSSRPLDWRASSIAGRVSFEPSLFMRGVALRRGRLTVTADDGRAEEVVVYEGDRLQVARGEKVAALHPLVRFQYGCGCSVAKLAEGETAQVVLDASPGDLLEVEDRGTGLSRTIVTSQGDGRAAVRVVRDGVTVQSVTLSLGQQLHVRGGDAVAGGDVLVSNPWREPRDGAEDSLDHLRRALDLARQPSNQRPRVDAPFDGEVTATTPEGLTLTGLRGERFIVRRKDHFFPVRPSDFVLRGDTLAWGPESLPRLLRAQGPRVVFERIVQRLASAAARVGAALADVHAELLARAMLDGRRVRRPGDSGLRRNAVLPRAAFERAVEATIARGGTPPEGVPVVRGLGALAGRRWKVSHLEQVLSRRRRERRRPVRTAGER